MYDNSTDKKNSGDEIVMDMADDQSRSMDQEVVGCEKIVDEDQHTTFQI